MVQSVDSSLPPQTRTIAFSAAGGGFGGALLAILVAKLLQGPCCCAPDNVRAVYEASEPQSAELVAVVRE